MTSEAPSESVVLSDPKCVHCGACTAVCPSGALCIEGPGWALEFREDKCNTCKLCVNACPVNAIKVST